MINSKKLIVLISLLLYGCFSLQRNEVIIIKNQQPLPVSLADVKESTVAKCEVFKLNEMPAPPHPPMEQMASIPKNKADIKVELLMEYAKTLRVFIRDYKNDLNSNYKEYLERCKK